MEMTITSEVRLAIEAGVKDGLKQLEKLFGDARAEATPDMVTRGLQIQMILGVDELQVGRDTEKESTVSLPTLALLALMVKRAGATREASVSLLREVMSEALALDKKASDLLLQESGVTEALDLVKAEITAKMPKTVVKKPVKAKGVSLTVQDVNFTDAVPYVPKGRKTK